MCATSGTLSYFHVHTAINILRCFGYPREHNFGLVLILSPTGCTEGCVYFPQSCRNTHLPHFLDCLLNTTLIPWLFSILHERLCDYSRVQSSVTSRVSFPPRGVALARVSNLKYESVRIDFKTVVFIRANPGKKETTDGSGSHVNFIQKLCTFPEVVSPEK